MTNRFYIVKTISNFKFKVQTITSFKIKDIDNAIVFFRKYIILNFSFSEIINEYFAIVKMFKNVRIVDNLSAKTFINMNIIESKRMIINVNIFIIECCRNFKVNFSVTSKKFLSIESLFVPQQPLYQHILI